MDFTISINDKAKLVALTKAREAHNASLVQRGRAFPPRGPAQQIPIEDHPDYCAADDAFVTWVVNKVISDAMDRYNLDTAKLDAQVTEMRARLAITEASVAAQKAAVAAAIALK